MLYEVGRIYEYPCSCRFKVVPTNNGRYQYIHFCNPNCPLDRDKAGRVKNGHRYVRWEENRDASYNSGSAR